MIKAQIKSRPCDTLYGLSLDLVDWFKTKNIEFHLTCRTYSGDDRVGYNHFSIALPCEDDLSVLAILFPEITVEAVFDSARV